MKSINIFPWLVTSWVLTMAFSFMTTVATVSVLVDRDPMQIGHIIGCGSLGLLTTAGLIFSFHCSIAYLLAKQKEEE